jgi:MFS family permease
MFGRALSGVAASLILSAGMAALNIEYRSTPALRASVMSLATTGIIAGVCCGPFFGGALYDFDERLPYVVLIIAEALLSFCVLCTYASTSISSTNGGADITQVVGKRSNSTSTDYHELPSEAPTTDVGGAEVSVYEILVSPHALWPLLAIAVANAVISGLEATCAHFLADAFSFSPGVVGAFYMFTSIPSCIFVALGPSVAAFLERQFPGIETGMAARRLTIIIGCALQGVGMLVAPKNSLLVEVISFFVTGVGMGLVDGVTAGLLGDVTDAYFRKSSKVFVLQNTFCQLGFVIGPVLGNLVFSYLGYLGFCLCFGGAQIGFALLWAKSR